MLKLVWLICDTDDGRRTTAVLANRKNSESLSIAPQNALSKKNHDLGSLCKKWGLRVSHVEKSCVFALKKSFLRQPGLLHFLVEIPRGVIYMHSLITFSSSISPSRLLLVSICSNGRQAGFHLTHNPKNIDEHIKKKVRRIFLGRPPKE